MLRRNGGSHNLALAGRSGSAMRKTLLSTARERGGNGSGLRRHRLITCIHHGLRRKYGFWRRPDACLSAHNGGWVRLRMNLARPKRLRKLPYESNQLPSDDKDNRECERLLGLRHDRPLRAIE